MPEPTHPPRVSFIVTGYNEERYIAAAVDGALNQNYSNLQVVLSDNASTDRTFEIMREMAANAPKGVDVVLNRNTENLHLSGNLQRASELADGDIIIRGCGDDLFSPDRAVKTVEYLAKNPSVLACACRYSNIDETGATTDPEPVRQHPNAVLATLPPHEVYRKVLTGFGGGGIYGCVAAYRRELFTLFPTIPSGILWDDQIMTFRALILGGAGWFTDNLVEYRIHGTNAVNSGAAAAKPGVMAREQHRARLCKELFKAIDVWERDLAHARKNGLPLFEREGFIESVLSKWKENRTVVGTWWDLPYPARLNKFIRSFSANELLPKGFMLIRLLPAPVYAVARALAEKSLGSA